MTTTWRFDVTPARLATFARVGRLLRRAERRVVRALGWAAFASIFAGLLIAIGGATWLAARVHIAFGLLAVLLAALLVVIVAKIAGVLRRAPTIPCPTGDLAIDDTGLRWHLDDGGVVELDWPGVVAWTDDGDAIYVLDAVGTGHVVPIDGDADPLRVTFAKRCAAARHVKPTAR